MIDEGVNIYMRKVLIVFVMIISLGLVACSNGNIGNNANKEKTTKIVNGVEVTLTDKAKKIENYEYVDEFQNLFNKLYKKYGEKVRHPDRDSIEYYKASKAQHKEFVESSEYVQNNLKGYELYSGISGEQGYYYEVYPVDPSIEQGDGGVIVYWDGTVGEGSDFY